MHGLEDKGEFLTGCPECGMQPPNCECEDSDGSPAPRERLAELREFLMERIDGSEETRAWDTKITGFIADIDAPSPEPLRGKYCPSCGMDTYYWLKHSGRCATCGFHWGVSPPSEKGTTGATPRTDASRHNMGSVTEPHYVVDVEFARTLEREKADLRGQIRGLQAIAENLRIAKQREADDLRKAKQMADHERDALLEELIALRGQLAEHERRYIDITMLTPHTEVAKIAFAGLAALKEST